MFSYSYPPSGEHGMPASSKEDSLKLGCSYALSSSGLAALTASRRWTEKCTPAGRLQAGREGEIS
jgi:hypothetical protein